MSASGGKVGGAVKPVSLVGEHVVVKIIDFCAEVCVHQRFENAEDNPIETIYSFLLPEGAAVCSFHAIIGGERIEGQLKEKEQAQNAYDDSIASGRTSFLLEKQEENPNMFKTSVGNLPPKQDCEIVLGYVTELQFNIDKKLEFALPVAERTVPVYAVPSANHTATDISFGLKIDVSLEMISQITTIESNHAVDVTTLGSKAAISFSASSPCAHAFQVLITLDKPDTPVFRIHENVGMLALYPNLGSNDEDPISEFIFLVDRSGSMDGDKIRSVRDTLQIFLRSLPMGTLFNIVGFGSTSVSLFEHSVEYNEDTLAKATAHVDQLRADLGGTSLLPPLRKILEEQPRAGIPRQLFVLTDGEVDNTQGCIDFVRNHSDTTRVFAFGICGASPVLVNGIAKAGEGKAELIGRGENVELKVISQLKHALKHSLTNVRVNWGNLKVKQTPYTIPPVFNGSRLILYGILDVAPSLPAGRIRLFADTPTGLYKQEVEVDPMKNIAPSSASSFIPKLAAKSMLKDIEESRSVFHKEGMNEQEIKEKAVALSIGSGILSKYTAFVATNTKAEAVGTNMVMKESVNLVDNRAGIKAQPQKSIKRIDMEFRATKTRLDEESACKTQQENFTVKLEAEIAKLREDLGNEAQQKDFAERNRKSIEVRLEDTRTQMKHEAHQRANADKLRRLTNNKLEDLREQVGHLEETSQDLAETRTRLEEELENTRKAVIREAEAREAAEIERAKVARELEEAREQYEYLGEGRKATRETEGSKDIQSTTELKLRVASLEEMENDYARLKARVVEEEYARRAAEIEKRRAIYELNEARSDNDFYKQQAEQLEAEIESEKKERQQLEILIALEARRQEEEVLREHRTRREMEMQALEREELRMEREVQRKMEQEERKDREMRENERIEAARKQLQEEQERLDVERKERRRQELEREDRLKQEYAERRDREAGLKREHAERRDREEKATEHKLPHSSKHIIN